MTITTHVPDHSEIPSKILDWMNQAKKYDDAINSPCDIFAAYANFEDEDELEKAIQYLDLWKYFMIKKIGRILTAEKRIYKPSWCMCLASLVIKLGFIQEDLSSSNPNNIDNA